MSEILKDYLDSMLEKINMYIGCADERGGIYITWARDDINFMRGVLTGYMTANIFDMDELKEYYKKLKECRGRLTMIEGWTQS